MRKNLLVMAVMALAAVGGRGAALYEGFNYTAGLSLGGLSPQPGSTWVLGNAGGAGPEYGITNLNLTYPGLAPSIGNALWVHKTAKVERIWSTDLPAAVSSGSIYYSLLLRVTDLTGLNQTSTAGAFFCGFNNAAPTATSTVGFAGARLQLLHGADPNHYRVGIRNDVVSGNSANIAYATAEFTTADTLFLVLGYTFNTGSATDDVASLWINPTPGNPPPSPDVTSTGADISGGSIRSFVLRALTGDLLPPGIVMDELRIGLTWDEVTPVPEPLSYGLLGLGALALLLRSRRLR
ncbi:MAG: PEP-CTERM sorting domain-containing protein [Verrucomicrobiae bacterium]|nr:PEP-CTERM sorting domain-containing protein [Verrucomicrobiae bacterium]MDW8309485.1 PEP-CTERM sorting domain-containing protein [Verrucomicrobiales bacterium]